MGRVLVVELSALPLELNSAPREFAQMIPGTGMFHSLALAAAEDLLAPWLLTISSGAMLSAEFKPTPYAATIQTALINAQSLALGSTI